MVTRESATPLYQQIEQHLLQEISSGALAPQSRLPSERELMKRWDVSRITVRQALNNLVLRGYLYTVPSKGFFVTNKHEQPNEFAALLSFSDSAQLREQVARSQVLAARLILTTETLLPQFQLPIGSEVVELVRLRYLDDLPVGIQANWLPHALCHGILAQDFTQVSLYKELRERYHHVLAQARMTISARGASQQEAGLLEMREHEPLLTVNQLTYDTQPRLIEISAGLFHPERYPLSLIQGNQDIVLPESEWE